MTEFVIAFFAFFVGRASITKNLPEDIKNKYVRGKDTENIELIPGDWTTIEHISQKPN